LVPALRLHDVDAERLVRGIVTRSGLELNYYEREDLEQFLLIECWKLSLRYESGRIDKGFGAYATVALKRRVVDWQRKRWGRTKWSFSGGRVYVRPRPELISFDADNSVSDRLDAVESTRAGDSAPGGDEDWRRLLAERDRNRIRDFDILGLEPPQRAAC
jgi:hypothetical protein